MYMRRWTTALLSLLLSACDSRVVSRPPALMDAGKTAIDAPTRQLNRDETRLSDYRGDVLLIVNVASQCGYTGQYQGLQALQDRYGAAGLRVIGFPCNDFGGQEPGGPEAIKTCAADHEATFMLMEKVHVLSGPDQSPVYAQLQAATGALPRWNFGKYLVDRNGHPVAFYGTRIEPLNTGLTDRIESLLQEPASSH